MTEQQKTLDEMTVEELREQPEYEHVQGRSSMNRDELVAEMKKVDLNNLPDDDEEEEDDEELLGVLQDDVGVQDFDDNYLGTAPEYQNAASISNAPVYDDPEDDEVTARVREHEAAMRSVPEEPKSFEEWTNDNKDRLAKKSKKS